MKYCSVHFREFLGNPIMSSNTYVDLGLHGVESIVIENDVVTIHWTSKTELKRSLTVPFANVKWAVPLSLTTATSEKKSKQEKR